MTQFLSKYKLIITGGVLLLLLFFLNAYNDSRIAQEKQRADRAEYNLKVTQDSVRVYRLKDSTYEYDKMAYVVGKVDELQKLNEDLWKETKLLKGEIKSIQKAEFKVIHDTVPLLTKAELIDSTLYINSKFDSTYSKGNYRSLAFLNKYNLRNGAVSGTILKDEIGFTVVTGVKKIDGRYEIFINPKYPNMKITSIEGAIIDKTIFASTKPKLITVGVGVGWTPLTYDFKNKETSVSLTRIGFSAGLNFNLGRALSK